SAGDLGKLKWKPVINIVISICLAAPGVWLTIEGWPDLSEGHSSVTPIGIILIGFALIILFFSSARLRQYFRGKHLLSLHDLEVMVAIHKSRNRLPGGEKAVEK
ncbi:Putative sulfoquinovose importer, partial [Durusdinium trenchii]